MQSWAKHLRNVAGPASFANIAERLLNRTWWIIAGIPHEPVEIEFYYRSTEHDEPFAHAHPIQQFTGRWYFHRIGMSFRGGTFKGVDLTFGNETSRGGILFRSVRKPDGAILSGPSLLVDYALSLCSVTSVSKLDQTIGEHLAWDTRNPLHLIDAPHRNKEVFACARVGLSLLKARVGSTRPGFLTRPYRFLTEPSLPKGRAQILIALHKLGRTIGEIRALTRCPTRTIEAYLAEYRRGLEGGSVEEYFGKAIDGRAISRLHGIAERA
jgi:hypothetical protein